MRIFKGFVGVGLISVGALFACSDDEIIERPDVGAGAAEPGMSSGGSSDDGMGSSDDGMGGSDDGMGGSGDGMGDGATASGACPDHPDVSPDGNFCRIGRGAGARSVVTEDLTLSAGPEGYILDGQIFIGDDANETRLTIEAGVIVYGENRAFFSISRNSKIFVQGTEEAPVVMTSSREVGQRAAEDWGGLVINGNAQTNFGLSAVGEAGTGFYGGEDDDDSSGEIRYLRVEFGGNKVDSQNELNGVAFQGVGRGTVVDYLQVHANGDDGVEFFGGTAEVKHLLLTGAVDDSLDWVGGWRGKAQFVSIVQANAGDNGIEADNRDTGPALTPISRPTLANVTLLGGADTDLGMVLRAGTQGQLHNFVVSGFPDGCLAVSDAEGSKAETAAGVTTGDLALFNSVLQCSTPLEAKSAAAALFGAEGSGNIDATEAELSISSTGLPGAGSMALGMGFALTDDFFDSVDYAGAFAGDADADDWTLGWTDAPAN